MWGADAAFLSNYFDHLFDFIVNFSYCALLFYLQETEKLAYFA